jgi:peroxiredoxin
MKNKQHLNFNHSAPDLLLMDVNGKEIQLSSLWQKKPLLLAFTRHFGCTQCKAMLEDLVASREKINNAGLNIAVILMGSVAASLDFSKKFAPGLLCLTDPDRKAYKMYGIERGGIFQTFLNFKVWKAIRMAGKMGYQVEQPPEGQDAMQMSGIFIVNRSGKIVLPYYFDHIADHPTIDLLLSGVLSTRWDQAFDAPVGPGSNGQDRGLLK